MAVPIRTHILMDLEKMQCLDSFLFYWIRRILHFHLKIATLDWRDVNNQQLESFYLESSKSRIHLLWKLLSLAQIRMAWIVKIRF